MEISISRVREAVQLARKEVIDRGVTDDIDVMTATLAALHLLEQAQGASSAHADARTASIPFPETFAEWAAKYSLATHNDQFLAAMMYLREKEHMDMVVTDDIVQLYKKARWEMPKNPADVIGKTANRHLVAEAETLRDGDGKKQWQMTKTGYDYLQSLRKENNDGK